MGNISFVRCVVYDVKRSSGLTKQTLGLISLINHTYLRGLGSKGN